MHKQSPVISVVIPNLNGMRWLPGCLDALHHQSFRDFEIIVVDNASTDDSCSWLRAQHPEAFLIELNENKGFSAAVNAGIKVARGTCIALLNTDTQAEPDWLDHLYRTLLDATPDVGGVCGKMVMMEDPSLIENAGDTLAWNGAAEKRGYGKSAASLNQPEEIFSPCAGGVLFRASFLREAGWFDESFFAYLEDVDLGLRGRLLGFRYLYQPSAILTHQGHGSQIPSSRYVRLTTANRLRLFLKNMPTRLLLKHLPSLVCGQVYFLIVHRRPLASLQGYGDLLRDWPSIREKRKKILALIRIDTQTIDQMLLKRMQQPGLLRAIWHRISP